MNDYISEHKQTQAIISDLGSLKNSLKAMSKSSFSSKMKNHGSGGTDLNNIKKAIRTDTGITADVKEVISNKKLHSMKGVMTTIVRSNSKLLKELHVQKYVH